MTTPPTSAAEKIKRLEDTLAYEQETYRVALGYPTNTTQFYKALEAHRQRIEAMERELKTLKATTSL